MTLAERYIKYYNLPIKYRQCRGVRTMKVLDVQHNIGQSSRTNNRQLQSQNSFGNCLLRKVQYRSQLLQCFGVISQAQ
uniref:Uncharacterized protein n=1 Tax=Romanomermis culicivorax TaxID=13658 RepID=A0A915JCP7_ROMCU